MVICVGSMIYVEIAYWFGLGAMYHSLLASRFNNENLEPTNKNVIKVMGPVPIDMKHNYEIEFCL